MSFFRPKMDAKKALIVLGFPNLRSLEVAVSAARREARAAPESEAADLSSEHLMRSVLNAALTARLQELDRKRINGAGAGAESGEESPPQSPPPAAKKKSTTGDKRKEPPKVYGPPKYDALTLHEAYQLLVVKYAEKERKATADCGGDEHKLKMGAIGKMGEVTRKLSVKLKRSQSKKH